jgi:hypothetical protein
MEGVNRILHGGGHSEDEAMSLLGRPYRVPGAR